MVLWFFISARRFASLPFLWSYCQVCSTWAKKNLKRVLWARLALCCLGNFSRGHDLYKYNVSSTLNCTFDSSLTLLHSPFFLKSATTDSVWYSDRNLSTNSWILAILPWSTSTASCGIPWMLRSTLNGFSSASCFPLLVGLPCCCFASGFSLLDSVPCCCGCCCRCCCRCSAVGLPPLDCQEHLRTIFGAERGVETLWFQVLSPCKLTTFSMQPASTESQRLWRAILFSCALVKWIQWTASWRGSHFLF